MPWNTDPPSDLEKIRRILLFGTDTEAIAFLQEKMDTLAANYPDGILTAQTLIAEWEDLQTRKATQYQDTAGGELIRKKVDVLEWEWSSGTSGSASAIDIRISEIPNELSVLLGIEALPVVSTLIGSLARS